MNARAVGEPYLSDDACALKSCFRKRGKDRKEREREKERGKKYVFYRRSSVANILFLSLFVFVFIFAATEERYFELTSRFDGPLADLSIKQVAVYDWNVTQNINNRWRILLEKLQNRECFCRRISSVPSRLPIRRSYPHFTQILVIILVPRVFFF